MTKEKIEKFTIRLFQDQLFLGNLVMFAGSMVASAGSYFYHFLTGRMLGPTDYGVLSSLISLTYFLVLPTSVLSIVIMKYTSALKEEKDLSQAAGFYYWLNRKVRKYGMVGFLILALFSPLVANFFHYSSALFVLLIGVFSLISLYSGVNSATLLGLLRFGSVSFLGVFQSLVKLFFGFILIFLGFGVAGAVFSLPASAIISYFLSIFLIRKLFFRQKEKISNNQPNLRELFGYSVPVLISTLVLTSFYTTDVLLVRHFLPPYEAGLYASLANLGKIIFFASASVGQVMFPTVSGRQAKGENYHRPLFLSLLGVFIIGLSLSLLFFLFPETVVINLYGRQYLTVAPLMGIFSIFMILYSLASLLINFYLAVSQTQILKFPVIAAVLQALLIIFFHQNILQVVWVNIFVLGSLLACLVLALFRKVASRPAVLGLRF